MKVSEQRVAELVVAHLESCGHDVYQEVEVAGGVADIVARAAAELWIVEVKVTWSLELLEQCLGRKRSAHRVFAATVHGRNFAQHASLARELGIGVLEVLPDLEETPWSGAKVRCRELPPRLTSRRLALADRLAPEHKTHAKAGTPGTGGRWTPFRATCEAVASFVRSAPGASIKQVVDGIRHHYQSPASARSSIASWVEAGKVDGVELRRENGRISLWPAATSSRGT